jgi:chromosome segregation ATPase
VIPVRRDDAKVFLREFTRELIREISPATKILMLAGVVVLVSGLLYLGRAGLVRYRAQPQQGLSQAESLKNRIDEQDKLLAHLNEQTNQTSERISDLMKTRSSPSPNSESVLNALSLPNTLWKSLSL